MFSNHPKERVSSLTPSQSSANRRRMRERDAFQNTNEGRVSPMEVSCVLVADVTLKTIARLELMQRAVLYEDN